MVTDSCSMFNCTSNIKYTGGAHWSLFAFYNRTTVAPFSKSENVLTCLMRPFTPCSRAADFFRLNQPRFFFCSCFVSPLSVLNRKVFLGAMRVGCEWRGEYNHGVARVTSNTIPLPQSVNLLTGLTVLWQRSPDYLPGDANFLLCGFYVIIKVFFFKFMIQKQKRSPPGVRVGVTLQREETNLL